MATEGSLDLSEVLDELEASREQIVELYQRRVQLHVAAYRSLSPQQLQDTAALLLTQFIRLMHYKLTAPASTQIHVSVLSEFLSDMGMVSRSRAAQGVGVGDLLAAILILVSAAREVVLSSLPEERLRQANQLWSEVELTGASALAWMLDEHHQNYRGQVGRSE